MSESQNIGNDPAPGSAEPVGQKSRRRFLKTTGMGGAALLSGGLRFVTYMTGMAHPGEAIAQEHGAAGANIALNRAAYQSSSADDDHTAHLSTDGSPSTFWESKPHKEAWVAVDLGKAQWFDRLVLRWGETYPESCLLYTSPSPRDGLLSRMPSSA